MGIWVIMALAIFLLPSLGLAEDAGAIVAALNDPQAECRYLSQLWKTANIAKDLLNRSADEANEITAYLRSHPSFPSPEKYNRMHELKGELQARQLVMYRSLNDYATAKKVVQAKRGTQDAGPMPRRRKSTGGKDRSGTIQPCSFTNTSTD